MKRNPALSIVIFTVAAVFFYAAVAFAQSEADLIATGLQQTLDALITSTPAVSVKEIKIAIIVNETLDTFRTGTPTPLPKPGNIETAVYATLAALEPTASLSAEDVEIAAAVSGTVQALLPTAMASASLMRTIDAYRAKITAIASTPAPPPAPPAVPTALPPAASAVPTAREIPDPVGCEDAKLVSHVSIPDGTTLLPAQPFKKTWRIQNSGSCASPWTPSYQLVYSRGERMNGLWGVHLTKNVGRGETVDISVDLTAPSAPGEYSGIWMMADGEGNVFGRQFQVRIAVVDKGLFACALVGTRPDGPGVVVTLRNTGTENWSENDVDLVYSSGEAPTAETRLDLPGNVPPGGTITFPKIDFNSGRTPGNSVWTLYNNAEAICSFGI
ncbi:hypothetical protein BEQ56_05170 [Anaerolineaceae bacterium oral taxon 439]|nr:hypothetical protein BEQ56_05170 [Anaerolineaceae bacterium oral taxon 439]